MGITLELHVELDRMGEVCERYGVARLDVFGATSHGDGRPDSDVDL